MKSLIKDALLWLTWHPLRWMVQRIPASWGALMLRGVIHLFPSFLIPKRGPMKKVLAEVFGLDPSSHESRGLVRSAFRVLLFNELDMFRFPILSPRTIDRFASVKGLDRLDSGLAAGRGVLLLFGHFGSNQMIMPAIGHRGYRMSQLSAPPTVWKSVLSHRKFSAMEERAMALRGEHDQSLPVTHINIFGSLKSAFKCLERNEILGIAADGGGGKERIALDFLGQKAWFSPGAARIALATRSAVLPTFVLRDGRGKNTLVIEPPLSLPCSGNLDLDSAALMQDFVHILERYVQDYKDHYLNFLALREYMTTQGDRAFIGPIGPV